jgi:hypothetical protein
MARNEQTAMTVPEGTNELRALDTSIQATLRRQMIAADGFDFDAFTADAAAVNLDIYGVGEPFDKDALQGVPFVILDWRIMQGNIGEYAFVEIVTKDNTHGFFTDGGVGITPFLQDVLMRTERRSGLYARRGLRRSDYTNSVGIEGTTYYIG